MNHYLLYSEQPRCARCQQLLPSWDPFASVHKHDECWAADVADKLLATIRADWNAQLASLATPPHETSHHR